MRRSLRWLVPGGVVAVIAATALAPGASADLPAQTPQEVLVRAAEADVPSFSGTIEARVDLGIPAAVLGQLDPQAGMGPGGPGGLGDDERTVRVWKDGDDLARVSVATSMGEQTLIYNNGQVWAYDSDKAVVTTGTVPDKGAASAPDAAMTGQVPDPAEVAQWLLDAVEPTTEVTAGEPQVVAGRDAYVLELVPTQQGTLIGSASMAVDAQTGAVLRVQVTAVGASEPAIDVGYTSFEVSSPPAEVFATATPPGATVEEFTWDDATALRGTPDAKPEADPALAPTVVGDGWTRVLVLPAGTVDGGVFDTGTGESPGTADGLDDLSALVDVVEPVSGGSVLSTSLLSVMIADDGRVLVGAVTPQVLVAAAAA